MARAATILSFGVGLVGLSSLLLGMSGRNWWAFGLFAVVVGIGAIVIPWIGLSILKPRDWFSGANVTNLAKYVEENEYGEEGLMRLVGKEYKLSVEHNANVLDRRANSLTLMVKWLAVQALVAGLLAVVIVFSVKVPSVVL